MLQNHELHSVSTEKLITGLNHASDKLETERTALTIENLPPRMKMFLLILVEASQSKNIGTDVVGLFNSLLRSMKPTDQAFVLGSLIKLQYNPLRNRAD